jgi:peptidoglycan-associated lipoprotein
MITLSHSGRIILSALSASVLVATGIGCADQKSVAPVRAPLTETAYVAPPAPPAPPPAISPDAATTHALAVSLELAAACKLNFNDADNAPKFDFDRSVLWSQDNTILSQIAKCVTTGPLAGQTLDLVGRADPRGENAYNMALGDRRANSVRDYLASLGVNNAALFETSRGNLDATGTEEVGWQRDRRVDIMLH